MPSSVRSSLAKRHSIRKPFRATTGYWCGGLKWGRTRRRWLEIKLRGRGCQARYARMKRPKNEADRWHTRRLDAGCNRCTRILVAHLLIVVQVLSALPCLPQPAQPAGATMEE
ncbi:hypothetical protein IFM47457_02960 [Aspergillus lentulus]|nr:hypothetical protein IFM47457_02960 [Aspergillus lentulus]